MKKKIIIIAAIAVVVLGIAAWIVLPEVLRHYELNTPDNEKDIEVAETMSLFSGDDVGYSFLYPKGCYVDWEDDGSACVFAAEKGETPYVLVDRTNKRGMSPESYFKSSDKQMLNSFSSVESTPIQEVRLENKTLYLTRYLVSGGGGSFVIDRYFEPYRHCYIQYTAVSAEADILNTIVYYAASTLRMTEGAYHGAFTRKTTEYTHPDTGVTMKLPDMLETRELTIGTFSSNDNAVLLSVLCTADDEGKPIYNRQDFIDRAAASPYFVAGYLGADSAEFEEGDEQMIGGRSFYCYPMTMQAGGNTYTGTLCIGNTDETGVYLLCYAVREGAPEREKLTEMLVSSVESARFK